jgi:predicted HTH transcriptional regulator
LINHPFFGEKASERLIKSALRLIKTLISHATKAAKSRCRTERENHLQYQKQPSEKTAKNDTVKHKNQKEREMNKKKDTKQLNKRQRFILGGLSVNPNQTARRMSDGYLIPLATVKRILGELKANGFLTREGADKKGKWVVIDPTQNSIMEDK